MRYLRLLLEPLDSRFRGNDGNPAIEALMSWNLGSIILLLSLALAVPSYAPDSVNIGRVAV